MKKLALFTKTNQPYSRKNMNPNLLIDSIVRQTTVLIATLATDGGSRAPLAHIANQVFNSLVRELKEHGVANKVIADMFGLALRTYHNQVSRLSESGTFRGRSLWEAVLAYIQDNGSVLRADVLRRFNRDDQVIVRGVLKDLVDSGMVLSGGRGDARVYVASKPEEYRLGTQGRDDEAYEYMVMVAIHRHGPLSSAALGEIIPLNGDVLEKLLNQLVENGKIDSQNKEGVRLYSCDHIYIPFEEPSGWEAAVFDHYQVMVTAICAKLRSGSKQARPDETVGGSTYHFNVWEGHPLHDEVLSFLYTLRKQAIALRTKVEKYNAQHQKPADDEIKRVSTYLGQTVLTNEREIDV
jgi:hypothetical protein